MSTITGVFVDANTGKPIPGVSVDFYPDGDRTKDPYTSVTSGTDGSFSLTSGLIDSETNALFDAYQTGYNERIGAPAAFAGTNEMTEVTEDTTGVSWWVPVLIIAIIIFAVWHFKLYKHF
jgi:hypothetical protein